LGRISTRSNPGRCQIGKIAAKLLRCRNPRLPNLAGDARGSTPPTRRRTNFVFFIGRQRKQSRSFFWSEEWNRERRGQVRQAWIPTAQELGGDFPIWQRPGLLRVLILPKTLSKKGRWKPSSCGGPAMPQDPSAATTRQHSPGILFPRPSLAGRSGLSFPAPNS